MAADHRLIRYDERGCGLSDWQVDDLSFTTWVDDLEAVVDTLGLERFPLLGISQGGPVAIEYAVRHPEKVTGLILYGSYALGWAQRGAEHRAENEALITLVRSAWGTDNPAYRQVFTSLLMPEATPEDMGWFNELQRVSASPENAAHFMAEFGKIDVRNLLPRVSVPTLVLHCRDDGRVPFNEGRRLAAGIRGARFVSLDGKNHLPQAGEPAWEKIVVEVRDFLTKLEPGRSPADQNPARVDAEPDNLRAADIVNSTVASKTPRHAVFLSYAHEDRRVVELVCAALEVSGLPCWMAPRDVVPGSQYAEAIVDAIEASSVMVVIFSGASNRSPHVIREVEQATSAGLAILPVRIEEVTPSKSMRYFLSTPQWLDAFPPPLEPAFQQLTATVNAMLASVSAPDK